MGQTASAALCCGGGDRHPEDHEQHEYLNPAAISEAQQAEEEVRRLLRNATVSPTEMAFRDAIARAEELPESPQKQLLLCRCQGSLAALHERSGRRTDALHLYTKVHRQCRSIPEGADATRLELGCLLRMLKLADELGHDPEAHSARAQLQDRLDQLERKGYDPEVLRHTRNSMEADTGGGGVAEGWIVTQEGHS